MLYSLEILQPTKYYEINKYKPAGLQTPISIGLNTFFIDKYGYPMSKNHLMFCKKDSYTNKAILTAKRIVKKGLLKDSMLRQCNEYLKSDLHFRSESTKILSFIKHIPIYKLDR